MKYLLGLCLLGGFLSLKSQTITSDQSGDWDDTNTWDLGRIPADGDDIIIALGHTVTLDGTPDIILDEVTLTINGILNMDDDGAAEANLTMTGFSGILLNGEIQDNVEEWTALNTNEGESIVRVEDDIVWSACEGGALVDTDCFAVYAVNYALVDLDPDNFSSQNGSGTPILMPATNNPLPVVLTSFNVTANGAGFQLSWSTASELNNDRFEVERSENGIDF